jgi:hypothetical protein
VSVKPESGAYLDFNASPDMASSDYSLKDNKEIWP